MLLAFLGMGVVATLAVWAADCLLERTDQRRRARDRQAAAGGAPAPSDPDERAGGRRRLAGGPSR